MSKRKLAVLGIIFMMFLSACSSQGNNIASSTNPLESPINSPYLQITNELEKPLDVSYLEYISKNGFEPCFTVEYACAENIIRYSFTYDNETIKYGYMDIDFNVLSNPISDAPSIFSNGLAKIFEGNIVEIIDKNMQIVYEGNTSTPFFYEDNLYISYRIEQNIDYNLDCYQFNYTGFKRYNKEPNHLNQLIPIRSSESLLWGYKTIESLLQNKEESDFTISPAYDIVSSFNEGLAAVKKDDLMGYINDQGEMVISNEYIIAYDFHDGVAIVVKDFSSGETEETQVKYGLIDYSGDVISDFVYSTILKFKDGYACATKESKKWTFININGEEITKGTYISVRDFENGYAIVRSEEGNGLIDTMGNLLNNRYYDEVKYFNDGLAAVKENGKWGYIDKNGLFIIEPQYIEASSFSNGVALVKVRTIDGYNAYLIDRFNNEYLRELNLTAISEINEDGYALAYSEIKNNDLVNRKYYRIKVVVN